jgi:hypothetical protein
MITSPRIIINAMLDQEVTNLTKQQRLLFQTQLFRGPKTLDHLNWDLKKIKISGRIINRQLRMTLCWRKKRTSSGFHQVQEIICSHSIQLHSVRILFCMSILRTSAQLLEDSAKNLLVARLDLVSIYRRINKIKHMKNTFQKKHQTLHHPNVQT